jgi:hypothetical protein
VQASERQRLAIVVRLVFVLTTRLGLIVLVLVASVVGVVRILLLGLIVF